MRLVLAGDVMTGRGVDQVLPSPGAPDLHEDLVRDARTYVDLAERVSGPIPKPVDAAWPWGDVLPEMDEVGPAVRVMNLETSVTRSDDVALGKAVTYRMSPANLGVLTIAKVDIWALANNHILDYGSAGLVETLDTMGGAGQRTSGAGRDDSEAWCPAVATSGGGGPRVLVSSVADVSSGVPPQWAAGPDHPGVALLPDLSLAAADTLVDRMRESAQQGDILVVSVHWGGNWGYGVPHAHRRFAHRLVDAGVHVVHGHSSHHPRPSEVYRDRLVLYGCGDLVNDYEGIGGYEEFRDDLRLLFVVTLDPETGELVGMRMVPFRARRLRLERASAPDARWLAEALDGAGRALGARVQVAQDGALELLHQ
jgi:poly-gamma-glutamate synthesis protein (capsule biosynthesis protein)